MSSATARPATGQKQPANHLPVAARAGLIGILVLAGLYLLSLISFTAMSLRQKLGEGTYVFTLPGGGSPREASFPGTGTATVESADYSNTISLIISGVSDDIARLTVVQHLCGLVGYLAIAAAVTVVVIRLLRGRPFGRGVTLTLLILAATIALAGSANELLANQLNTLAYNEITGGNPDTPLGTSWQQTFTGGWVAVGLGLAAITGAFRLGERMQRDTDGLV